MVSVNFIKTSTILAASSDSIIIPFDFPSLELFWKNNRVQSVLNYTIYIPRTYSVCNLLAHFGRENVGFCRGCIWLYHYHAVKNHGLRKSEKKIRKNKFLFLSYRANKYWISHKGPIKYFISHKSLISWGGSMLSWNRNQRAFLPLTSSITLGKCGMILDCLPTCHSSS